MSVEAVYKPQPTSWSGWRLMEKRQDFELWFKAEHDDKGNLLRTHYREVYDSQPAVDYAKILRDNPAPKGGDQEWTRQQMVIPPILLNQAIREGWSADMDQWRKIARDIDYRKLRTTDEKV